MTDECIIPSENGVQKAKSLHCVTPKEKFLVSLLEKAPEFPSNDVAENLMSAIETHQDHGSSRHRRMRLTIEVVMRIGADAKESENSRGWVDCESDRGAPTANSGDAAGTDTKHSERADGFTDGNGSTGTQRAKESATE